MAINAKLKEKIYEKLLCFLSNTKFSSRVGEVFLPKNLVCSLVLNALFLANCYFSVFFLTFLVHSIRIFTRIFLLVLSFLKAKLLFSLKKSGPAGSTNLSQSRMYAKKTHTNEICKLDKFSALKTY